jgi:RHS repeat-associated protein
MAQQKASGNYSNPYLFNGKELDEETGLYYYGARYYNLRYSVWLGVDPMVEKYAGITPYNFVMNNPINLVDPTGLSPTIPGDDDLKLPKDPNDLNKVTWVKQQPENIPEGKGHTGYYKHKNKDLWLAYDKEESSKNKTAHYHLYEGDGKGGVGSRRFNENGDLLPKNMKYSTQAYLEPGSLVRLSRAISNIEGAIAIFFDITAIFSNSPRNPLYMFYQPGDGKENRAYQHTQTGLIYEWNTQPNEIRQVNYFKDYDYIDGEWRGIDQYRTDYFDKSGRKVSLN